MFIKSLFFLILLLLTNLTLISCNGGGSDSPEEILDGMSCSSENDPYFMTVSKQEYNANYSSMVANASSTYKQEQLAKYIIDYKGSKTNSELQTMFGTSLIKNLKTLGMAIIEVPEDSPILLNYLSRLDIVSVDKASSVFASPMAQVAPNGITRVKATPTEAWAYTKGNSIKVAILDTGIDMDHIDLHVVTGINFTDSGSSSDWDDRTEVSHGTHVAGTACALDNGLGVVGVAPECSLYAVKVLGDDNKGDFAWVLEGIEWSINNDIDVINMSLGAEDTYIASIDNALRIAEEAGIIVVASAGNDGRSENKASFPGNSQYVLGVAALDESDSKADFSHSGPTVDIAAPGTNVLSTTKDSNYDTLQGTSMASPHVAGVAALAKSMFGFEDAKNIKDRILCSARDLGVKGRDNQTGHGIVDALAVLTENKTCSDSGQEEDQDHRISAFTGTKIEYGSLTGIAIKIHMEERSIIPLTEEYIDAGSISFTVDAYTDGELVASKELTTDSSGTAEAGLREVICGAVTFKLKNFKDRAGNPIEVSGRKELIINVSQ